MSYIKTGITGIRCRDLHSSGKPGGKRYLFRIRNAGTGRERTRTYDSYEDGLKWAQGCLGASKNPGYHHSTILEDCLQDYLDCRQESSLTDKYIAALKRAVAEAVGAGAKDLADPGFRKSLHQGLIDVRVQRGKSRLTTEPAAITRLTKLYMIRAVIRHAIEVMRVITQDPSAGITLEQPEEYARPIFRVWELKQLVSERARWNLAENARKARIAVDHCAGNHAEAARRLGWAHSTVHYHMKRGLTEDPMWLFAVIAIYTGMRSSENAAMCWEWIDWHANVIVLPAKNTKKKRTRYISMMPELRAILEDRHQEGATGSVHHNISCDSSNRSNAFLKYLKRVGIKRAGPDGGKRSLHSLRANCGALMVAMGLDSLSIIHHLGHTSHAQTGHYTQLANLLREEVRKAGWVDTFRLRSQPVLSRGPLGDQQQEETGDGLYVLQESAV